MTPPTFGYRKSATSISRKEHSQPSQITTVYTGWYFQHYYQLLAPIFTDWTYISSLEFQADIISIKSNYFEVGNCWCDWDDRLLPGPVSLHHPGEQWRECELSYSWPGSNSSAPGKLCSYPAGSARLQNGQLLWPGLWVILSIFKT